MPAFVPPTAVDRFVLEVRPVGPDKAAVAVAANAEDVTHSELVYYLATALQHFAATPGARVESVSAINAKKALEAKAAPNAEAEAE